MIEFDLADPHNVLHNLPIGTSVHQIYDSNMNVNMNLASS
jgi:hypothetical protein